MQFRFQGTSREVTGFQAKGSLGRRLVEAARQIRLSRSYSEARRFAELVSRQLMPKLPIVLFGP